ncbi:MAG TPA: hypothetical protein VNJ07_10765 [Chitinophagales bacterium]|nr:hypothetical protein [Chitinophagales bacterium]
MYNKSRRIQALILSKNFSYAFVITFFQLTGCYVVFGCWLEEYEAVLQYFFAGVYTMPPYELVFIDVYGGIIPLLSQLALAAYPLPVNEYLLYAFTAICCFIINYSAFSLLENAGASKVSFAITVVIFSFLLFPQFFVLLQCTRASVLAGIAAFFAAAWFFVKGGKSFWQVLLIFLLLAAGTVLRLFTAGISTALLLALAFFIWRWSFLRSWFGRIFIMFFLLQAGLAASLMNYRVHHTFPGERYTNYEHAVNSRSDLFPLPAVASRHDSLRYELLRNWLVTDTAALSEAFVQKTIRHVTLGEIISDPPYLKERLRQVIPELAGLAHPYFYIIIILFGFIFMMPAGQMIAGAGWILLTMVPLVVLSLISSVYERGFAPLACLLVFGTWLLWVTRAESYRKKALPLFLLLTLTAAFFSWQHLENIRHVNQQWLKAARQFSKTASEIDSLQPVMMPSADMVMFSSKAFEKFPPRQSDRIIMLNAGYLSFFDFIRRPYREKYNLDITNGKSVAEFIRLHHQQGVALLTTAEGIDLFRNYLDIFYNMPVEVNYLDIPPIESPQHKLYFFRLKTAGEIQTLKD